MGALAAHWQAASMAQAPVTSNIHQAFDRLLLFAAEVAFHLVVLVDNLADSDLFLSPEVVGLHRWINLGHLKNLECRGPSDAVDVGERSFHALVSRQLHSGDSRHLKDLLLSLPLFMAGVDANDQDHTVPPDYLAVLADPLDRRFYFH
jgi:hypothetical protein